MYIYIYIYVYIYICNCVCVYVKGFHNMDPLQNILHRAAAGYPLPKVFTYVYMYISICVDRYMYAYVHVYMYILYICIYAYMYICTYVCVTCIHVYMYTNVYMCRDPQNPDKTLRIARGTGVHTINPLPNVSNRCLHCYQRSTLCQLGDANGLRLVSMAFD